MDRRFFLHALLRSAAFGTAARVHAASPRALLTEAAYCAPTRARARALLVEAQAAADAAVRRDPGDREAELQQAVATGWRAMVAGEVGLAREAKRLIERQIVVQPNNAEAHLALGACHLEAIRRGGMMARALLGADRNAGNAALDRALALDGERALIPGYAALLRAATGGASGAAGRSAVLEMARRAAQGATPTALDAIMKAHGARLVPLLLDKRADAVSAAARLLPFAHLARAAS